VAAAAGEERTAQELLPQCWAQLDHKYPERRVLVADSCGLLAPLVHAGLRGSLILSILQQVKNSLTSAPNAPDLNSPLWARSSLTLAPATIPQLLDDPAPLVREAAARNLARLIHLLSSHDKYAAVETACLRLASDDADDVVSALLAEVRIETEIQPTQLSELIELHPPVLTKRQHPASPHTCTCINLLPQQANTVHFSRCIWTGCFRQVVPALHVWVQPTELLHTRLLPGVMAAAIARLKACPPAEHYRRLAGADCRSLSEVDRCRLTSLLRFLEALVPALRATILRQRHVLVEQQLAEEAAAVAAGELTAAAAPPLQV
jgi:hypothetical protein